MGTELGTSLEQGGFHGPGPRAERSGEWTQAHRGREMFRLSSSSFTSASSKSIKLQLMAQFAYIVEDESGKR